MHEISENSELAKRLKEVLDARLVPENSTGPISKLSATEWRSFKDSAPWQEFLHALEVQLKHVQQAYNNAVDIEQFRLLQGQAKILESMMSYPDEVADMIEGMREFNKETDDVNRS